LIPSETALDAFARDGSIVLRDVLTVADCRSLSSQIEQTESVGNRRLLETPWCAGLAQELQRHPALARLIPADYVAVQCTYFEKSPAQNWLVAFHQDLSIPVLRRVDDASLGGWSEKDGTLFVQAPIDILQQMIAVRLHLDPCGREDGPLRVIPGSHRYGRVMTSVIAELRNAGEQRECLANEGTIWLMRPLLLHASSKASGTGRRRVLHFVYGPRSLTHGLQWKYAA